MRVLTPGTALFPVTFFSIPRLQFLSSLISRTAKRCSQLEKKGITKVKDRNNAEEHLGVAVEVLAHGALEDKLWQTVVEAATPFEIDPRCACLLRAWNATGVERMKLEGRLSPEDWATAENNLKGFIQLMKSEGVFIGDVDRLDNDCFCAAHRTLKRSSILGQFTLWPFLAK
jgi:hypothetical protein